MAEYVEALITLWDGKSKGAKHMVDTALDLGLEVYVHIAGSRANKGKLA